jgi:non-heme chloroperoxidase
MCPLPSHTIKRKEETPVPYVMLPDEVPMYYEAAGRGKNILFIHGGAACTKFWQKQVSELSSRYHVLAIDLRGHGNSGKTDDSNCVAQYGRDLRHLLEDLGLDEVVVVGWSLGGSVVWSYIEQFGVERLAGYVNVEQPPHHIITETEYRELIASIRTRKFRTHWERLKSFSVTELPDEDMLWMTCEMMKTPTGVYCAVLQDARNADFRHVLPRVIIPTLICAGTKGLIDTETVRFMTEAMPRSRVVMFQNCSHMLFWEQPKKFNREVAVFVEEATR